MKRYDKLCCDIDEESESGGWVRFEDVAQLERDYEATRAINVRLQGEVDRLTDTLETIESVARGEGGIGNLIARRAAAALRPDTAAPVSAQEGPGAPIGWQPIETAPHMRDILVHYVNPLGNGRIVRACYFEDGQLENDGSQEEEYAPAGWYESSVEAEHCDHLSEEPTHWMPLPAPPEAAGGKTP